MKLYWKGFRFFAIPFAAAFALIAAASSKEGEKADLVLRNGKIVTVDPGRPHAEAIAVRGDTILAVGSNKEIAPYVGEKTQVIELAGKLTIPGFIEGHGHFTGIGQAKMNLDLMAVKNWGTLLK